ncbi:MAG TPA: hypothetical protein VF743_05745 [Acidimicrobiales bacterium]
MGLLAVVVGVALLVGVVVAATGPDRADGPPVRLEPSAAPARHEPEQVPDEGGDPPAQPTEWDARITGLIAFIEQERGLTYDHPVPVDLLAEDEYVEAAGGDDGSLGFYDGYRIVGRGTDLNPALQGTLVHELTHVLDDQHFDIFGIEARAGVSREESVAYAGLVEGDAIRIEAAYDRMLIASGVDPYDVADIAATTGPAPGTPTALDPAGAAVAASRVPAPRGRDLAGARGVYGWEISSLSDAIDDSPYFVGEGFLDVLVENGGNAAVDAAFRDPPVTTEQILDPRTYIAGSGAVAVAPPEPAAPAGEVEPEASAGALNLYLLLAAGIEPLDALDAVTGWGGESVVSYEDTEGRDCVDLAVVGDTVADTAEIGAAMARWVDTGVAAAASTAQRPDGAQVLTACGLGDDDAASDPYDALSLAEARSSHVWAAMRDDGLAAGEAFSFGECVVHGVDLDTLLAIERSVEAPPGAQAEVDRVADRC